MMEYFMVAFFLFSFFGCLAGVIYEAFTYREEEVNKPTIKLANVDALSNLIDRLCVTVNKLSWLEYNKFEEYKKDNRDIEKIAKWDHISRNLCNLREELKNKIDETLAEIVSTDRYTVIRDEKTFSKPRTEISELIDRKLNEITSQFVSSELPEALKEYFNED